MELDLSVATGAPLFVALLVIAAFLGKLLGSGVPAYWGGFNRRDSLAIGAGMSARGAVELIIAGIALQAGLFEHPKPVPPQVNYLFSAVVIVAIVTTLATPLLLKWIYGGDTERRRQGTFPRGSPFDTRRGGHCVAGETRLRNVARGRDLPLGADRRRMERTHA